MMPWMLTRWPGTKWRHVISVPKQGETTALLKLDDQRIEWDSREAPSPPTHAMTSPRHNLSAAIYFCTTLRS